MRRTIQRSLQGLILDRPTSILDFLNNLGLFLFDDWRGWFSEQEEFKHFVFEQARGALYSGEGQVRVNCIVEPLHASKIPQALLWPPGGPGNKRWEYEATEKLTFAEIFVKRDYWADETSSLINEDLSQFVDTAYLFVSLFQGVYPVDKLFFKLKLPLNNLIVPRPRTIFESSFGVQELATEDSVARYKRLVHPANHELLSFCWRFLCITQEAPHHGLANKLVRQMKSYLERHRFPRDYPSDALLEIIAARVVKQFINRDLNSSVIARSLEPKRK